jgi:hypothetical protein
MVRITSRGGFHFFLFTNKGVPIFRLLRQIMPPDGAWEGDGTANRRDSPAWLSNIKELMLPV